MLFKTYCVSSSLDVEQNNGICIKKIDSFGQYLNKLLLLDLNQQKNGHRVTDKLRPALTTTNLR